MLIILAPSPLYSGNSFQVLGLKWWVFFPRIFLDSFLSNVLGKKNLSLLFIKSLLFLMSLKLNYFPLPALDSSSTTSSASPVLNNYDALEGGGYPGNQFVLNYLFRYINMFF